MKNRNNFWAISWYSCSTSNQNASRFSSECFNISVLSLAMLASSSFSAKVNCPLDGSDSTNGFWTQLYWSVDIDGKYLLRLVIRVLMWFKINGKMPWCFLSITVGNISTLPRLHVSSKLSLSSEKRLFYPSTSTYFRPCLACHCSRVQEVQFMKYIR